MGVRRVERSERGTSLVEFSLLVPVFFMLVLGMFSGGQAYNQKLSITHAAREGARYGATVSQYQAFSGGSTWASTIRDVVVQRSSGTLTAADVCVSLVQGSTPTVFAETSYPASNYTTRADGTACYNDGSADPALRVEVSISHAGRLEFLLWSQPVNLVAQGTAKFEPTS